MWSPDGKHLAFTLDGAKGLELWVADASTGKARRLGESLASELKPEGIDVLTLCVDGQQPHLAGTLEPRALAKQAIEQMDQGPVITFAPQTWTGGQTP